MPDATLRYICDLDDKRLASMKAQVQPDYVTNDFEGMISDPDLDAVVIATNGPTHFDLCQRALLSGKDVYVEKPFVLSVAEAEQLVALAESHGRILMVGHLLEYHPVVTRLKEMISGGDLGEIRYIYSQRLNLGTVRVDENALWNFAPHDISIILFLLGMTPTDVSARG
ncbi:MAG: Gfo/Idh/MocA family oxidoreductase, partial [Phycisphaerae bacterium]|nr:Gfo/Idh/MocA family oxidoreductase [Phycisphaerae bacterium]